MHRLRSQTTSRKKNKVKDKGRIECLISFGTKRQRSYCIYDRPGSIEILEKIILNLIQSFMLKTEYLKHGNRFLREDSNLIVDKRVDPINLAKIRFYTILENRL